MATIQIEKFSVGEIPVLTFSNTGRRCPLVFLLHGFTGCKENEIEFGYRMAEAGLFAVAIDAHLHGERLGEPVKGLGDMQRSYVYPVGTGFDTYFVMLECALHTASDLDTLIDHFAANPRVNTERVGVTGFSMGGFATYFAAANNSRITTVVPMGAYPALSYRWQHLILEATAYQEWTSAMDALGEENRRRANWLCEIDPAEKMIAGFRKPLFIINGDLDTDSPKFYSVPFFGAMRPFYQNKPDQLRFRIYDGVAHQRTGEMMQDAVQWFDQFLNG